MNAREIYANCYEKESKELLDWCDEIYSKSFGDMFSKLDDIYTKLHLNEEYDTYLSKMSESELSYILIDLPMELYRSAEPLNKLRAEKEFFKLKSKTINQDVVSQVDAEYDNYKGDVSYIEDQINARIAYETAANKLMITAYDCVIKRVENQMSFCKELIMGCKKIWDSRRRGEDAQPISEQDGQIPDSKFRRLYIK